MNDLDAYRTRKSGNYTPSDVIEKAQKAIGELGAERVIVVVQTKGDHICRLNTQMDNVELTGLLEVAKILEFTE